MCTDSSGYHTNIILTIIAPDLINYRANESTNDFLALLCICKTLILNLFVNKKTLSLFLWSNMEMVFSLTFGATYFPLQILPTQEVHSSSA